VQEQLSGWLDASDPGACAATKARAIAMGAPN
jgi:hypothetical protein